MARSEILKEILSDPNIIEKYNLKEKEIEELTTNAPYYNKVVEVLSVIIDENDNHLNTSMIYKKLKKAHNIG